MRGDNWVRMPMLRKKGRRGGHHGKSRRSSINELQPLLQLISRISVTAGNNFGCIKSLGSYKDSNCSQLHFLIQCRNTHCALCVQ